MSLRPETEERLRTLLLEDRTRAEIKHGPGAWDVADVMEVVTDFVDNEIWRFETTLHDFIDVHMTPVPDRTGHNETTLTPIQRLHLWNALLFIEEWEKDHDADDRRS